MRSNNLLQVATSGLGFCPQGVGRGVVIFVFLVSLPGVRCVQWICVVAQRLMSYHRLVKLLLSAGLAGGGMALLASALRTGLPSDLSLAAGMAKVPPPILPKS